jgi:hypothetical protein
MAFGSLLPPRDDILQSLKLCRDHAVRHTGARQDLNRAPIIAEADVRLRQQ